MLQCNDSKIYKLLESIYICQNYEKNKNIAHMHAYKHPTTAKETKVEPFTSKVLGGGLLGLPTSKPMTPRAYKGLDRAKRR